MKIKIITTFKNALNYTVQAELNNYDSSDLWYKYMVDPIWNDLTKWAPFDVSNRKPVPIKNISTLKEQIKILSSLSIGELHSKFDKITTTLPINDDEPLLVALYPICDDNKKVKKYQNGVLGTSVFGNILININPLAEDYYNWIFYVFAHEYHHCVWGNNWFSLRKGQGLNGTFLEYMLNEGQADLFAMSLFPQLIPRWNQLLDKESEEILWKRFRPILFNTDPEIHNKFMFGDEVENLPWCIGYVFGRSIVEGFIQQHPNISFIDLINITAIDILNGSRFKI